MNKTFEKVIICTRSDVACNEKTKEEKFFVSSGNCLKTLCSIAKKEIKGENVYVPCAWMYIARKLRNGTTSLGKMKTFLP